MKKTRLSSAVEILGALGLILSLVFVGFEIRQNTKVARAEAYRSFMSELNESYAALADSSYASFQVYASGKRANELNAVERFRVFGSFMVLMRTYEGLHKQVTSDVLDESALLLLSKSDWNLPVWKDLWPSVSRNLTPDFVSYFETTHDYGTEVAVAGE